MILPTKHVPADRALIGVGADLLGLLVGEPKTVSALWNAIRENRSKLGCPIAYEWFILALDFLFIMGVVEFDRGLIRQRTT